MLRFGVVPAETGIPKAGVHDERHAPVRGQLFPLFPIVSTVTCRENRVNN